MIVHEKYEWSNNWWNNADDKLLKRVLIIGDSISCCYHPVVIKKLRGKVNVDRVANSRSLDDPMLFGEVSLALENCRYQVVHFNNGLHGWHLTDAGYRRLLARYVELIREKAPRSRLIWATSTPVTKINKPHLPCMEKNPRVIRRNEIAVKIMAKYDIEVNDLYSLVFGNAGIRAKDGYHYNAGGAELMGRAVAGAIRRYL
ncbi:MAG TPA: SGNH/GDSL hydrolase family protein [Phycisphaerae bacterium]|nr:SGNH/GDSL hydrolase family protein [Phycisphaerae bacterium]HPS53873.1 SGNH/GDSL hydrolase family protein [Phycisphaerae bacterium]